MLLCYLSITSAQNDPFSSMYGSYVVSSTDLSTCRTSASCSAFCCPLNVTVSRVSDTTVDINWYYDPTTYSRCGSSNPNNYPYSIRVGISSITTSNIITNSANVLVNVPISANFITLTPQSLYLVQGAQKQCQIPTGTKRSSAFVASISYILLVGMILAFVLTILS